jgi:dienelactone hydrolase
MADLVLFHHVQGLTPGVIAFAKGLAESGLAVHTPDLYDGHTFEKMEDGFAYLKSLDEQALDQRVDDLLAELPNDLVYAGISWGVSYAQRLAQTREGAVGALFFEACFPISGEWAFGPWPTGLPVQIHGMDHDEFFALEGDLDAARELVAAAGTDRAEVFTYPGDAHLFVDSSLPSYDEAAARLALERSRAFLASL